MLQYSPRPRAQSYRSTPSFFAFTSLDPARYLTRSLRERRWLARRRTAELGAGPAAWKVTVAREDRRGFIKYVHGRHWRYWCSRRLWGRSQRRLWPGELARWSWLRRWLRRFVLQRCWRSRRLWRRWRRWSWLRRWLRRLLLLLLMLLLLCCCCCCRHWFQFRLPAQ